MEFKDYLRTQMAQHPSFQPRDAVKQAYQAAFGAEHLLKDPDAAERVFMEEYNAVEADDAPLFDPISPTVFRANLGAWKKSGLEPRWLAKMFFLSSQIPGGGKEVFEQYLAEAEELIFSENTPVSPEKWQEFIKNYRADGMGAVRHSPEYHAAERPAYRIVSAQLVRLLPILQKLPLRGVIAIDGRAASGKFTMAAQLAFLLDAPVVHMDDFFVPPALRSDARTAEPGGNVHYERFMEEVLPQLAKNEPFRYNIFDCDIMELNGFRDIPAADRRIVEGSYSHHPKYGAYAALRVFSDIAPEEQTARILTRNGTEMARMFRDKWIPLEETYFDFFKIREKSDVIV